MIECRIESEKHAGQPVGRLLCQDDGLVVHLDRSYNLGDNAP